MRDGITELERSVLEEVIEAIGGPLTAETHAATIIATHHFTAMFLEMSEQIQRLDRRCMELRQFIA